MPIASRWDSTGKILTNFFGVWSETSQVCSQCAWDTLTDCDGKGCAQVEPSSNDEGVGVWDGGACSKCSNLDVSGCNTTALCEEVRREDEEPASHMMPSSP